MTIEQIAALDKEEQYNLSVGSSTSNFLIKAADCNHLENLVFGGAFMAEIDLCCADCCAIALRDSKHSNQGVTHKFSVSFLAPAYKGDRLMISARAFVVGAKSIGILFEVIRVMAFGESYYVDVKKIAEGHAIFISVDKNVDGYSATRPPYLPYVEHGLNLATNEK